MKISFHCRRSFFLKNCASLYHVWTLSKNISAFCQKFFMRVVRNSFYFSIETIWGKIIFFKKKSFFHIIFEQSAKHFRLFETKMFRWLFENDVKKRFFFEKNYFPSNCFYGEVKWISDNPHEKLLTKGRNVFAQSPNVIQRSTIF